MFCVPLAIQPITTISLPTVRYKKSEA